MIGYEVLDIRPKIGYECLRIRLSHSSADSARLVAPLPMTAPKASPSTAPAPSVSFLIKDGLMANPSQFGDTFVFNFVNGTHNVVMSCNSLPPLQEDSLMPNGVIDNNKHNQASRQGVGSAIESLSLLTSLGVAIHSPRKVSCQVEELTACRAFGKSVSVSATLVAVMACKEMNLVPNST
ncbi:hypothetical protein HAX54_010333 [Datura stramonium]|uniref:Uncharacterized protein n=1 Tax=Datura stramonium TaxID=4076 RepID=A0ABS8THX6_DATST|nr:hypothetical protein [Datura stramonium]